MNCATLKLTNILTSLASPAAEMNYISTRLYRYHGSLGNDVRSSLFTWFKIMMQRPTRRHIHRFH